MHLKKLFAELVCCKCLRNITDELSIDAYSVDPEQTAPFAMEVSLTFQQTSKAEDFCCDWCIKG